VARKRSRPERDAGTRNLSTQIELLESEKSDMANRVTRSIIVDGDTPYIYDLWAAFETFPNFMKYIKDVRVVRDNLTHWVMEGPLGTTIEWEAEITRREKNKRLGWNSKGNETGDIKTSGEVTFTGLPKEQTEVTVTLQYDPPAGIAGEVAARLFANPEERLEEDLRNFKRFAERRLEGLPTS
jgi:uncharacterized membrane protein